MASDAIQPHEPQSWRPRESRTSTPVGAARHRPRHRPALRLSGGQTWSGGALRPGGPDRQGFWRQRWDVAKPDRDVAGRLGQASRARHAKDLADASRGSAGRRRPICKVPRVGSGVRSGRRAGPLSSVQPGRGRHQVGEAAGNLDGESPTVQPDSAALLCRRSFFEDSAPLPARHHLLESAGAAYSAVVGSSGC